METKVFDLTEEVKCFTAQNRGGLKECIETKQRITKETAKRLIDSKIYDFYCYDERIKADRYILINMQENLGLPTWINVYKK